MSNCASCTVSGLAGDLCQATLLSYLDMQAGPSAASVAFLPRCVAMRAKRDSRRAKLPPRPENPGFSARGGRIIGMTPFGNKADPAAKLAMLQMALRAWRNYKPAARLHG